MRPIYHWTENRVRGHVALCVLAATIEAVMAKDLVAGEVMDPDLPFPAHDAAACALSAERRPPRASSRRRQDDRVISRRTQLQKKVLDVLGVDTSAWDKAVIA